MTAPGDPRSADDLRRSREPGGEGPDDGPGEVPVTDPAHRLARWVMVLAPLLLGVLVFLLLRLSTR